MTTLQRLKRAQHHQHPIGIDEAERVAKAMFRYAYPRGYGKHRYTWAELHSLALGEWSGPPAETASARREAQRIRNYWRTLAYIACRELEHE